MSIIKHKGGQLAYSGHVVSFPQNTQQLIYKVLPHPPDQLGMIVIRQLGTQNRKTRDYRVRKQNIIDWLHILATTQPSMS